VGVEESIIGKGNGGIEKKDAETEEGSMGNSESDQASGGGGTVLNISAAQRIPDTRHISRLQSQMEEKCKD
jgi:hypothetical protein